MTPVAFGRCVILSFALCILLALYVCVSVHRTPPPPPPPRRTFPLRCPLLSHSFVGYSGAHVREKCDEVPQRHSVKMVAKCAAERN